MAQWASRAVLAVLLGVAVLMATGSRPAAAATLTDGDSTPDWQVGFAGYGSVGITANQRLTLSPAAPQTADETHAALVVSQQTYTSSRLRARVTLNEQLRVGTRANPWESGWLVTRYSDPEHFYYAALKTNGWELGKRDPAYPGGQRFLVTGSNPQTRIGQPPTVVLTARGNRLILKIDAETVASFRDTADPYASGRVGFYCEDADVTFDRIAR